MHTIIWVFIAAAFGLMLFTGLQDNLPDELSFLKSSTGIESLGQADPGSTRSNFTYKGWKVRQEGPTIEMTRSFSGNLEANNRSYDLPEFGILCNEGKLDARIDTRSATTGTANTPVTVSLGGAGRQMWVKGTGMNVFPPSVKSFVFTASKALEPIEFTLSYTELGNQKVKLDTTGLAQILAQLPKGCKA
jgi:hypothetical protein